MALSLESQWTLVACGVMAHADGVLDGEECDRLLSMVEDEADGEEYSAWLATISDSARLEEMLRQLPEPPAEAHREILENAWTIAVVDGERSDSEATALERIATRLGVESVQLEFWREAWTTQQHDLAEVVVAAACVVLAGDAPVPSEDRAHIRELAYRLPTAEDHREELVASTAIPHDSEAVARSLRGIPKRRRQWLIKVLADLPGRTSRREDALVRLRSLGTDAGLSAAILTSLLGA
ncbi:MAG: TerB family tellurite resistance protein [Myxococcota bacterium]